MLVVLLLGVELLDELYSGVPTLGSADIQAGFEASYTTTASALLVVPGLIAFLVEPVLFVLSDRYPRKWFVCGGLFTMAVGAFAAALAPNVMVLSAALTLAFVGSGCGVALSQATLVDARPQERERVLARWTLLGEIGDLLAPILTAAFAASAFGWRGAFVAVGVLVLGWGLWLLRRPFPATEAAVDEIDTESGSRDAAPEPQDDGSEPSVLMALITALRNRRLLLWLGATALCDLLDEIVLVFAVLYLRDHLGADAIVSSLVVGAGIVGSLGGVVLTERLLSRVAPLRLLLVSSVACLASYLAWLTAPSVGVSALLFFAVGLTTAPMYPIASAQAYGALPGRSGTVNAAGHVFSPLTLAMPWLLGVIADSWGVHVALMVLVVQPLGMVLAVLHTLSRGSRHRNRFTPAGPSQ